jgi:hypothetical protein
MASDIRTSGSKVAAEKRRRSERSAVLIPIKVRWEGPGGKAMKAEAQAKEVNIYGGLLQFLNSGTFPVVEMKLTNLLSGEEAQARPLAVRRSKNGTVVGLAVELLLPSETFWGMTFRLRKTTEELQKLEEDIRSEKFDSRILQEFRDSVDFVRTTAWAVQECQERQVKNRDTATVLPLLVTERVRRAIQLCAAIRKDLHESKLTSEMTGIDDLLRATENLSRDLAKLFVPHT